MQSVAGRQVVTHRHRFGPPAGGPPAGSFGRRRRSRVAQSWGQVRLPYSVGQGLNLFRLTADKATFAATFAPATLYSGIEALPASFATTFNPGRLIHTRTALDAVRVTFATTFNDATLTHGLNHRLTAGVASFVATFNPSALTHGGFIKITADQASYAATFYAANLVHGVASVRVLTAARATFGSTFYAVSMSINGLRLTAEPVAFGMAVRPAKLRMLVRRNPDSARVRIGRR